MRLARLASLLLGVMLLLAAVPASAQAPPPYGAPITLEQAKKVMAGAEAEARKNGWNVVITIVDSGGNIVLLERLDSTQFGSIEVARQKAWSAAAYRRPGKVWQDALAQAGVNLRLLRLEGASPFEGGHPLVRDGKIIGAIGVSGATGPQDDQIARAGVDALK
ncbi:MAG: hypothetical protein A3G44_07420 [Candidatus Rokubacteria bacterium RIFCSPLOWO2_12_FULL_73_47]|nr:MAG: hypothetical protein A3G44_07420 [Candidatus Rokubacteria bacterium RIFCSPLOWO2_12_FULL_73_47]